MANELILAVDDEAHILELLSFNLEASGYRVVTAATGEDALVVCAHERPAMVLLDIMLPGIDGMEVCRRLKSAPTTADIPIIMLTARESEEDQLTGLTNGADNYITRPFRLRILKAHIDVLVTCSHHLNLTILKWGLPARLPFKAKLKQAIPACPAVLFFMFIRLRIFFCAVRHILYKSFFLLLGC